MTARNTKLNGAELLERLGVPVLAEAAPRVVRRVPFVSMEGNGSGKVSTSAGGVREYLADLGNPEQDRAAMLRRMNVRHASWFWETAADTITLSRRLLGKGFRAWRSSGRRAVPSWQTGDRFPVLSRFRSIPGVFPLAMDLPKLGKVSAEGENVPAAYLEQLGTATLNRVRSSSPRWRGTARHRAERVRSIGLACPTEEMRERVRWEKWERRTVQAQREIERGTVRGRTPEEYLEEYLEQYENVGISTRLQKQLRRRFIHQLREAARINIGWLREFLRLLREYREAIKNYPSYVGLILADFSCTYQASVYAVEEKPNPREPEQLPRPPDLLPLPPAAPLAPPA